MEKIDLTSSIESHGKVENSFSQEMQQQLAVRRIFYSKSFPKARRHFCKKLQILENRRMQTIPE